MTDRTEIISPDTLLQNIRNAFDLGHTAIAQMTFTLLDAWISEGGRLPAEWGGADD